MSEEIEKYKREIARLKRQVRRLSRIHIKRQVRRLSRIHKPLSEAERLERFDHLIRNGWNVYRTAKQLGMHHQTLVRFVDRWAEPMGIEIPAKRRHFRVEVKDGMKRCVDCGEWKVMKTDYTLNPCGREGYENVCKACRRIKWITTGK